MIHDSLLSLFDLISIRFITFYTFHFYCIILYHVSFYIIILHVGCMVRMLSVCVSLCVCVCSCVCTVCVYRVCVCAPGAQRGRHCDQNVLGVLSSPLNSTHVTLIQHKHYLISCPNANVVGCLFLLKIYNKK